MITAIRRRVLLAGLTTACAARPATAQRECRLADLIVAPTSVQVDVGARVALIATGYDAAGTVCQVISPVWSSSNANVARVDENGFVYGVSAGVALVSARVTSGPSERVGRVTVVVGTALRNPPVGAPAVRPVPAATPRAPPRAATTAAAADPSMTAGYAVSRFRGTSESEALEFAAQVAAKFDSLAVRLRETFANASGAAIAGATGPTFLSSREKNRWRQCRAIHFDIRTYSAAVASVKERLPDEAALRRAADGFYQALQGVTATSECDSVVSMLQAPDWFSPWQQSYETSARAFYQSWYGQLRTAHEAARYLALRLVAAGQSVASLPTLPTRPSHPVAEDVGGGLKRSPVIVRDTDLDGVPDIRDRCPSTPLGVRANLLGCTLREGEAEAPSPGPTGIQSPDDTLPPAPQEFGWIRAGKPRLGHLGPGDWTMSDGTWADVWYFQASAGQQLIIELRSRQFDAYLQLLGPSGTKLAEDDDSGGGGGSSRITYVVKGGRYQIVVNNFGQERAEGDYTLSVR